jgi:hypothetical protein
MEVKKAFRGAINRPTFVSGGMQGDRIRDINGRIGNSIYGTEPSTGAFYNEEFSAVPMGSIVKDSTVRSFAASRVVPTGPDAAPVNLSKRLWRLVSLS